MKKLYRPDIWHSIENLRLAVNHTFWRMTTDCLHTGGVQSGSDNPTLFICYITSYSLWTGWLLDSSYCTTWLTAYWRFSILSTLTPLDDIKNDFFEKVALRASSSKKLAFHVDFTYISLIFWFYHYYYLGLPVKTCDVIRLRTISAVQKSFQKKNNLGVKSSWNYRLFQPL